MMHLHETRRVAFLVVASMCLAAGSAWAGAHTWDVNEIFSDASGNIQFVELFEANGTPNETGLPTVTLSSNAHAFTIGGGPIASPTSNKTFLVATAAFAALPGAPAPDATIPAGFLPYFFSVNGDTVSYGPYDALVFGPGVLPTDGVTSLNRDLTTGVNSPKNYAGQTGSVVVVAPAVPLFESWPLQLVVVTLIGLGGALALRQRVKV